MSEHNYISALRLIGLPFRSLTEKAHRIINFHTRELLSRGLVTYGRRGYIVTAAGKAELLRAAKPA